MPLSEEEMRLLEQMERALVAEDPKLASTMRGKSSSASSRRRLILAVVFFAVGITVLMTGAIMRQTFVGVAGFLTMLVSAYFGLMSFRRPPPSQKQHPSGLGVIDGGRKQRPKRPGLSERFEDRWRRRRENGGF